MRPILLYLYCFLVTSTAVLAEEIRFIPPAPDTRSFVKADLQDVLRSSSLVCPTRELTVSINGPTVTIDVKGTAICPPIGGRGAPVADIGVLAPGLYDVVVNVNELFGPVKHVSQKLIVRDVEPFLLSRVAGPISGGGHVVIVPNQHLFDFDLNHLPTVSFDGVPGLTTHGNSPFDVIPPPHAPGTVDVTVGPLTDGTLLVAKSAFTYFDPTAPPDPLLHEPLLFPLSYSGGGAFGSQWTTENVLIPKGPVLFKDALPCDGCGAELGANAVTLTNDSLGTGKLLYAIRSSPTFAGTDTFGGRQPTWKASSRIRETARNRTAAGTEVPVVREESLRCCSSLELVNVPAPKNARATIRVYALGDAPVVAYVVVMGHDPLPRQFTLTRSGPDQPLYGAIDITSDLNAPERAPGGSVDVQCLSGDSCWAMLTITDNDTQQVTVITP
jgi:hypothetical protein